MHGKELLNSYGRIWAEGYDLYLSVSSLSLTLAPQISFFAADRNKC